MPSLGWWVVRHKWVMIQLKSHLLLFCFQNPYLWHTLWILVTLSLNLVSHFVSCKEIEKVEITEARIILGVPRCYWECHQYSQSLSDVRIWKLNKSNKCDLSCIIIIPYFQCLLLSALTSSIHTTVSSLCYHSLFDSSTKYLFTPALNIVIFIKLSLC